MKTSRLLLGGVILAALLGNGCVITSAQVLAHYDLPNPFTIVSSTADHSERVPVDLSDVEGHQSVFRTPLAIVAWPARSAWLFATRATDGAHLEVIEVTAGTSRPRSVWQGPDGCAADRRKSTAGRGDR